MNSCAGIYRERKRSPGFEQKLTKDTKKDRKVPCLTEQFGGAL
jgi:hypothetical protein